MRAYRMYAAINRQLQAGGNLTSHDYRIRMSERWGAACAAARAGALLEGQSA